MRSESGIPRPFQPNSLAQELRDLRREVAELKARRSFVSVERIVEGGTINENVGTQLTEVVQREIVIERQNLAEAALTDVVVTGSIASVGQTHENPPRELKAQLGTVQRVSGSDVPIPALVFIVGGADPALAPGIYSPDGDRLVMGAQDPVRGGGTITAGYHGVTLGAGINNALTASGNDIAIGSAEDFLGPETTTTMYGNTNLDGNVKVNGAAYGAPQERVQPPLNAGWSQWTASNWNGIWIEQMGKLTIISGAVSKATWAAGETIANLPARFRPANKASGNNCEVQANGDLNIGAAGSGASALSITYFAA